MEQQERERPTQKQASPRAGTPVGALMGVVPSPSTMGMINQTMSPGNPPIGSTSVSQCGSRELRGRTDENCHLPLFVFSLQFHSFMFVVCFSLNFICEIA